MSVEQEQLIILELTEEKAESSNVWTDSVLNHLDRPSPCKSGLIESSNIWKDYVLKHLGSLSPQTFGQAVVFTIFPVGAMDVLPDFLGLSLRTDG